MFLSFDRSRREFDYSSHTLLFFDCLHFAGLKAGGIAAFGCGVLGFTGGTVLKRKEELAEEASETTVNEQQTAEQNMPLNTAGGDNSNNTRVRPVDPNKED